MVGLRALSVLASVATRAIFAAPPRPLSIDARLAMFTGDAPLARPLTIHWDDHQIPVIEAAEERDLAVGTGLVHAHLRLAQIEILRRLAAGRLSEVIGPAGLDHDYRQRRLDLGKAAPAIIATLTPDAREWIEGFIAGYNHYVARLSEWPPECRILRLDPEPWTLAEFIAYGRAMASDWTREGTDALARARASLPAGAWRDLWRRVLGAGVPPEAATRGSNAFALAGRRTARGAALVAADPHLPLGLPGLCFVAGLQGPRTRAVGVMMPGVPTMPIGRNEDIAWGSTNLYARTSDLVEAKDLPLREAFAEVTVRGGKPRRLVWRESDLGPIVNDTRSKRHAEPIALRWMGHAPSDETGALLAVARARDWTEFRAALDGFAVPGLNFTFADREGRIGQLRAAHVPRDRARHPDDLLLTPDQAWTPDARATAADLPAAFDPDEGFVVSANEAPPEQGPVIGFYFPPSDRALRLRALIEPLRDATVDDLRHLQADVFHAPALAGRDQLLAALGSGPRPAKAQAILDRITAWDGFYDAESIGATAYEFTLARLVALALKHRPLAVYDAIRRSRALIFEDLAALPPAALRRVAGKALAAVARHWPADARWGTVHALAPRHPLHALPRIGRAFAAPRLPGPGCNDTVAKTSHGLSFKPHAAGFGAALRHVADLADPDANWFRLFGGQDGWAGSENALDQLAGWHQGADIQVPLRLESVRRRFTRRLVIRPA